MNKTVLIPLLVLSSLTTISCQQSLRSESGLYNVELEHSMKVPVKGYWTWGKGNPYANKKDLRIYIHPMDVTRIIKHDPEAAPVMAHQMHDYVAQALVQALNEANTANKTAWKITANAAESDVCIHTALVSFRRQRPVLKTLNATAGSFIDIPGVSNVLGYISDGNVSIECSMRDTRTGQLLLAFKDANRKKIRLYSKDAYSYTGNADANLKEWAGMIATVIRNAAEDKIKNSTLRQQVEERSWWDVFSQRAYREIPEKEDINAWEAL